MEQKYLINSICLLQHRLQSLLWHLDNLLQSLIQFDLSQFVGTFYHCYGLFSPLLVYQRVRSDLILPLLIHPGHIVVTFLARLQRILGCRME